MPILGVRLDPATHRSFKLWAVRRDKKMSDVLRKLVKGWIAEQERLEQKLVDLQKQGEAIITPVDVTSG